MTMSERDWELYDALVRAIGKLGDALSDNLDDAAYNTITSTIEVLRARVAKMEEDAEERYQMEAEE